MGSRALFPSFLLCLLVLFLSSFSFGQSFSDPDFVAEPYVTLSSYKVVGIAWAPDGRAFIWQKDGVIRVFKQGSLLATPFLNISAQVNSGGDRGLIGLAFDPNFASNGYIYAAYVYEDPSTVNKDQFVATTQRVSRFQADPSNPDVALAGSETVILGKIATPGCSGINQDCSPNDAHEHTIDHLAFAPDGNLFVSLGEGSSSTGTVPNAFRAQNLDILNGKILRITRDGKGLRDNPFYTGNGDANRSKVWAYGLRNPYRFTLKPGSTTDVYVGDVGWYLWEEIDRGRGKNFGWPCWEGGLDSSGNPANISMFRYQADFPDQCAAVPASAASPPLWAYAHNGSGASINLGPFYTGGKYPAEYSNNLFFGDYNLQTIRRAVLDESGAVASVKGFATGFETVNIVQGPDGYLYCVSFTTGVISRIKYNGTNTPPIAKASATPTSGYSPLNVSFSSAGSSDPKGNPLTYSWDFGDGGTSTSANPAHTYVSTAVKAFTATLTVKDSVGGTAQSSVKVTVGSTPPQATISAPGEGSKFKIGEVVTYSGGAVDQEDGTLSGGSLLWTVLLHHNQHVHTIQQTSGTGGSFVIEQHDNVDPYYYEVLLTATDTSGLSDTQRVNVYVDIPNGTLQGQITNASKGTGLEGATVSFSGGSTKSDIQGFYSFVNIPAGSYNVTASKTGYLTRTLPGTVTGGVGTTLNIPVATAGKVSGKVTTGSGSAIANAMVTLTGGVIATTAFMKTSSTGDYGTNWVPVGNYSISVSAAGFSDGSGSATVSSGVTAVKNFSLSAGSGGPPGLNGRVTSVTSGAALAGATVSFSGGSTTTDSSGKYSFSTVADGSYAVTAKKSGYLTRTMQGTVAGGSGTLDIALATGGKIAGKVTDSSGASLANATVTIKGGIIPTTDSFTTNATGDYNTNWVPTGDYVVSASAAGYNNSSSPARVTSGATSTLNLTLSRGNTCSLGAPGAMVCAPPDGATVSSPAHWISLAKPSAGRVISAHWVYVDDVVVYKATTEKVDTNLTVSAGTRRIRIQAWDSSGALFQAGVTVQVQ